MRKILFSVLFIFFICGVYAQSDTLNRTDKFGKKYGYWKKYENKVLVYEGRFYNGEPAGKMTYYYPDGKIKAVSEYAINSPKVNCVLYHENGKKSAEGIYINKKKDGKWLYYDVYGKLISEENYVNCKKDGAFRIYSSMNNVILEEVNWKNNKKEGPAYNNYANGKIRLRMSYKNDKIDGAFENYYENGKLWTKGSYRENFRNGEWITYNSAGKESMIQNIEKGKVLSTVLGFESKGQWIKLNANAIAYFYQGPVDIVIQLKDKKRIEIQNDHLFEIAERAGSELFMFVNANVLSSYTAIKKITPSDERDEEASVMLKPDPDFEVYTDGDYYKLIKCLINKEAPVED